MTYVDMVACEHGNWKHKCSSCALQAHIWFRPSKEGNMNKMNVSEQAAELGLHRCKIFFEFQNDADEEDFHHHKQVIRQEITDLLRKHGMQTMNCYILFPDLLEEDKANDGTPS